jgi:hypothetical protein
MKSHNIDISFYEPFDASCAATCFVKLQSKRSWRCWRFNQHFTFIKSCRILKTRGIGDGKMNKSDILEYLKTNQDERGIAHWQSHAEKSGGLKKLWHWPHALAQICENGWARRGLGR